MTIHIELNPEMEARMSAEAQARGITVESYAQQILQESISSKPKPRSPASQQEFREFLNALESKATHAPHLTAETFSREMIYGEHD
jgi:hypothetical protein